ncbi:MAG: type-F conjugative transfer system secretin TraK [Alphaproteobacteria bacterium]|nr:type-F conjugative transfer system secretin TraK [Alphaproteobacteria bacterium]
MKTEILGVILLVCFSVNAEQFEMTDEIIHATISYQNLNRIKVKNDYIISLTGINEAFHLERNQTTGEVLLRPTEKNGYSPISCSVTTLSGKTQDLVLDVIDGEANTIELIAKKEEYQQIDLPSQDEGTSGNDYEETICEVMKKFINLPKDFPEIGVKASDRNYAHLTASLEEAYSIDGYIALKYKVTTKLSRVSRLDERMFSRKGDISLSLSSLEISPNSNVSLYVLRH